MGRKAGVIEFYDPEIKERYITESRFEGERLKRIRRVFTKTKKYEDEFQKDVSSFTPSEIGEMCRRMGFSSINVINDFMSYLRTYAYWALKQNLIYAQINYYSDIKAKDMEDFLNKVLITKRIVTREEIEDWCDFLADENASDAFSVMAIFEGIGGDNWIDFGYLKIKDFKRYAGQWSVQLITERTLKVSNELKQLADQSNKQSNYLVYDKRGFWTHRNFVSEDLVVKRVEMGHHSEIDDYARGRMFYMRTFKVIEKLKEHTKNPALSIKGVRESGMVHYARLQMADMGETLDEYVKTKEFKDLMIQRFCFGSSVTGFNKQRKDFVDSYRDFLE